MKNLLTTLVLCLFASLSFAQVGGSTSIAAEPSTVIIERELRPGDGRQVLQLNPKWGTVEVIVRGGAVVAATHVAPNGGREVLKKISESDGAPTPPCKCKLPDACYSSIGFTLAMCQCNPCNLSPKPTVSFALKGAPMTIVNNTGANH